MQQCASISCHDCLLGQYTSNVPRPYTCHPCQPHNLICNSFDTLHLSIKIHVPIETSRGFFLSLIMPPRLKCYHKIFTTPFAYNLCSMVSSLSSCPQLKILFHIWLINPSNRIGLFRLYHLDAILLLFFSSFFVTKVSRIFYL